MTKLYFCLLLLLYRPAQAANYYVSPSGNDANNGTSPNTAWKTASRVNSHTFSPGDIIMFQRGGEWRESLVPSSSGSTNKPITFSAYGSGRDPIFNGANIYNGNWSRATGSSIWQMNSPLKDNTTFTLCIDGTVYSRVKSISAISSSSFFIDKQARPNKIFISSSIDPNTKNTEISTRAYGIYVSGKSNISLSNFIVKNCLSAGVSLDGHGLFDGNPGTYFDGNATVSGISASNCVKFGIVTGNGYSHTLLKNCVSFLNGNGFYADGNANNTVFEKDTAYDNYRQTDPATDGNGFGIYKSSFNTVEHCLAYDNKTANGIEVDLSHTDSGIVIRYNIAHNNGSQAEGYGIKTGNPLGSVSSNMVYYNLSYSNGNDPSGGMGREFYHHDGNISFYNNTAYTTGTVSAYGLTIGGKGSVVVVNNLIYAYGGKNSRCIRNLNSASLSANNNLYFSTSSTPFLDGSTNLDFSGWKGMGYDRSKSMDADAQFTSNGRSFSLKANSPAINGGSNVDLSQDILGNPIIGAPDIGAFEYVSSTLVANAGAKQTITLPLNEVTLNGSKSSDHGGTIQTIEWSQLSGPQPAHLASPAALSTAATQLVAGTYVFKLSLTDNLGENSVAYDTVLVIETNQKPVANAGPNRTVVLPVDTAVLDGSKSTDPDGRIVSYYWQKISGKDAGINNPANSRVIISGLQVGQYIFGLTVTDNKNSSTRSLVTITVKNSAPVITADAGSDMVITLPTSTCLLNGGASKSSDGDITSYEWTQVGGPAQAIIASDITAVSPILGLIAGDYTFLLTVKNRSGKKDSDSVKVTVLNSTAQNRQLLLYEVPAHNTIKFRLVNDIVGNVFVNIYDMNGKLVHKEYFNKTQNSLDNPIDISQLARGSYTLQTIMNSNNSQVSEFVKQ